MPSLAYLWKKDFTDINFNSVETKGTRSAHIFEDLHILYAKGYRYVQHKVFLCPKFKIMNKDLKIWLKIDENESSSGL